MAALRLRLQKEMFDVTEEQLLALAHVTNSQVRRSSSLYNIETSQVSQHRLKWFFDVEKVLNTLSG